MEPHDGGTPVSPPAARLLPATVLELAFGNHDFTIEHRGREVQIHTSQAVYEGEAAEIEVTVIDRANETPHGVITHRYRIEQIPGGDG